MPPPVRVRRHAEAEMRSLASLTATDMRHSDFTLCTISGRPRKPHFGQPGLIWAAHPLLRNTARQLSVGHGQCKLTGTRRAPPPAAERGHWRGESPSRFEELSARFLPPPPSHHLAKPSPRHPL